MKVYFIKIICLTLQIRKGPRRRFRAAQTDSAIASIRDDGGVDVVQRGDSAAAAAAAIDPHAGPPRRLFAEAARKGT